VVSARCRGAICASPAAVCLSSPPTFPHSTPFRVALGTSCDSSLKPLLSELKHADPPFSNGFAFFFAQPAFRETPRNGVLYRAFNELKGCVRPRCSFSCTRPRGTITNIHARKAHDASLRFSRTGADWQGARPPCLVSNDKQRIIEHYDLVSPFIGPSGARFLTDIGFVAMNRRKKHSFQLIEYLLSSQT